MEEDRDWLARGASAGECDAFCTLIGGRAVEETRVGPGRNVAEGRTSLRVGSANSHASLSVDAMSLLARSAAPLRQVAVRSRAAPVRSMHGEYKVR